MVASWYTTNMDYHQLRTLVREGLSIREISTKLNGSYTNVRYWLEVHGLRTKKRVEYKCPCGEINWKKFYGHKRHICGECQNRYVKEKGQENKKKMVELLGGKCVACDYNKFLCSLDIHHTDPRKKDPNFSTARYWSWKRIEKELKHCKLLCRNCHAAHHAGHIEV